MLDDDFHLFSVNLVSKLFDFPANVVHSFLAFVELYYNTPFFELGQHQEVIIFLSVKMVLYLNINALT